MTAPQPRTCIALLRGVNVGKAKRVPMVDWRRLLQHLGCTRVQTLLNSGNAVFALGGMAPARFAAVLGVAMEEGFGFAVPVIVKSGAELAAAVRGNPLTGPAIDASRLLVAFTQQAGALAGLAHVAGIAQPREPFALGPHAAYLYCPDGISNSRAANALLSAKGEVVTTRNWATVLKLQALARDA